MYVMSTDRLWLVLTASGGNVQENQRIRGILNDAGLSTADAYSPLVNAGVLDPRAGKGDWAIAGMILGRGGRLVVLKRDGRTRTLEDLGAVTCNSIDEFTLRVKEGML